MKKTTVSLLTALLALSVTGCGSGQKEEEQTPQAPQLSGYLIENASRYVTLGDYQHLSVVRDVYLITEDEIEAEILSRLEEDVDWVSSDEEVTDADLLTLTLDWSTPEGTSGHEEDYEFELGMWEFGQEFDEAFYGHKKGDAFQMTLDMPEDIWQEDWAGRTVTFSITLTDVLTPTYPEMDEAYYQEKGYDSYEDYADAVRQSLEDEYQTTSNDAAMDQAFQEAMDQCIFTDEVPDALYDLVADGVHTSYELDAQEWGMSVEEYYEMFGINDDTIREEILYDVHSKLFVSALYQAEHMELSQEDYDAFIAFVLDYDQNSVYESEEDLVAAYGQETLVWSAYTYYAQQFLYEHATVEDQIIDYSADDLSVPEDPEAMAEEVLEGIADGYVEDEDDEEVYVIDGELGEDADWEAWDLDDEDEEGFGDGLPVEDAD